MAGRMVALAVALPVAIFATVLVHYARRQKKKAPFSSIAPLVHVDKNGEQVEAFGAYVVRQLGLDKSTEVADAMEHLADEYLRTPGQESLDLVENKIHLLLQSDEDAAASLSESDWKELYNDIKSELDMCLYAYFGFNWDKSTNMLAKVTQARESSKLRNSVLKLTRKERFNKVLKDLGQVRQWQTLLDIAKAVQKLPGEDELYTVNKGGQRPPVLLMIGGGMGAGKSTVVKEVINKRCFWRQAAQDAVVVEADAFKEKDIIYHALSSSALKDTADKVAQFVHDSSTHAASSLLVSALNSGRDVIFDGTMSWAPFVMQTIEMARKVHITPYRIGPGYQVKEDGSVEELYWEPLNDATAISLDRDVSMPSLSRTEGEEAEGGGGGGGGGGGEGERKGDGKEGTTEKWDAFLQENAGYMRSQSSPAVLMERGARRADDVADDVAGDVLLGSPERVSRAVSDLLPERRLQPRFLQYHVEMVGVMCDPALAVMRGIRRAIFVGRGVPVESQLRSHRLFAQSLEMYCDAVDQATVFSTNEVGSGQGRVIAMKEKDSRLLTDPQEFPALATLTKSMNEKARSAAELYSGNTLIVNGGDMWASTFTDPKRRERQLGLGKRLSMFVRNNNKA